MIPEPYEGELPYIFASYAHRDKERILPYISALQRAGFNVWYDKGIRAGYEWETEIIEHLDRAKYFIYFVTASSLRSTNCKDEIYRARNSGKPFINILLDDIDFNNGEFEWFEFRYGRYQMIPAYASDIPGVINDVNKGFRGTGAGAGSAARPTQRPAEKSTPLFTIEDGAVTAYNGSFGVEELTFPEGVHSIECCIILSNVRHITIPRSLHMIDEQAFMSCYYLSDITYNGTVREWKRISKGAHWLSAGARVDVDCLDGTVKEKG